MHTKVFRIMASCQQCNLKWFRVKMLLRIYLQLFCKFFSWNFIIIIVPTTPKGNFFSERKKAKEVQKSSYYMIPFILNSGTLKTNLYDRRDQCLLGVGFRTDWLHSVGRELFEVMEMFWRCTILITVMVTWEYIL